MTPQPDARTERERMIADFKRRVLLGGEGRTTPRYEDMRTEEPRADVVRKLRTRAPRTEPSRPAPPDDETRRMHKLVLAGLGAMFLVVIVVMLTSLGGSEPADSAPRAAGAQRTLPPYWRVRSGQSYGLIAAKTGLSIDQLEEFNPQQDPAALLPGTYIKLRRNPPPRKPKQALLPRQRIWVVRTGQSLSFISGRSGVKLAEIRRLNPKLKERTLVPGDRVTLMSKADLRKALRVRGVF